MSSTSPTENIKLIVNALASYTKETGKDLSESPFASKLKQSNSPGDILRLLEEWEKAFEEYREGNRRLINCLNPVVKVLHAFSGILSEVTSLVCQLRHLVSLLRDSLSSDPLPTSKGFVGWGRYSPRRTSLEYALQIVPLDV